MTASPTRPATTASSATSTTAQKQPADYAIGRRAPTTVEHPATELEVAAVLRRAADAGQAVVPWGAGTKQHWGNPPRAYNIALDLGALRGIVEYEPADLVVTAQAATPLADLQRALGEHGQFLALDPPYADRATLGGTLATNASGPSRLAYGTARDIVLGLRVATPEGEIVKSGGKVVKNVVGYDLNKLHLGALGTVGVMVEVTLKVHPQPTAQATIRAIFTNLARAAATAAQLARSVLYPRAVELVRGNALHGVAGLDGAPPEAWQLLVWAAGSPATVDRQVREVSAACTEAGATGVQRLDGDAHQAVWAAAREFGREPGADDKAPCALLKLTCLPTQLVSLLVAVDRAAGASNAPEAVIHAGNGVASVRLAQPSAEMLSAVGRATVDLGGHAVVEAAPDTLRADLDVWDPSGTAYARRSDLDLMRTLKQQFDPKNVLNPGRFVAGI